ncbi:hypothetical protein BLOT_015869 [Blomia tropicalis]|nr:hypothetical protein BLOT_015869 [Blomia tropicalis]
MLSQLKVWYNKFNSLEYVEYYKRKSDRIANKVPPYKLWKLFEHVCVLGKCVEYLYYYKWPIKEFKSQIIANDLLRFERDDSTFILKTYQSEAIIDHLRIKNVKLIKLFQSLIIDFYVLNLIGIIYITYQLYQLSITSISTIILVEINLMTITFVNYFLCYIWVLSGSFGGIISEIFRLRLVLMHQYLNKIKKKNIQNKLLRFQKYYKHFSIDLIECDHLVGKLITFIMVVNTQSNGYILWMLTMQNHNLIYIIFLAIVALNQLITNFILHFVMINVNRMERVVVKQFMAVNIRVLWRNLYYRLKSNNFIESNFTDHCVGSTYNSIATMSMLTLFKFALLCGEIYIMFSQLKIWYDKFNGLEYVEYYIRKSDRIANKVPHYKLWKLFEHVCVLGKCVEYLYYYKWPIKEFKSQIIANDWFSLVGLPSEFNLFSVSYIMISFYMYLMYFYTYGQKTGPSNIVYYKSVIFGRDNSTFILKTYQSEPIIDHLRTKNIKLIKLLQSFVFDLYALNLLGIIYITFQMYQLPITSIFTIILIVFNLTTSTYVIYFICYTMVLSGSFGGIVSEIFRLRLVLMQQYLNQIKKKNIQNKLLKFQKYYVNFNIDLIECDHLVGKLTTFVMVVNSQSNCYILWMLTMQNHNLIIKTFLTVIALYQLVTNFILHFVLVNVNRIERVVVKQFMTVNIRVLSRNIFYRLKSNNFIESNFTDHGVGFTYNSIATMSMFTLFKFALLYGEIYMYVSQNN